jgi:hypothetical protein
MSVDRLLDELRSEFEGEVAFHATVPANPTAPSIIVAPADPFLEPGTHGTVRESWDVLVAFRIDAPERNVGPMRDYSLRIRAAAARAGAVWESASGPRRLGDDKSTIAVSANRIHYRYPPPTERESP